MHQPNDTMNSSTEQQFLRAYEAHTDALFRYCYFRVYHRERAQELTQETFMKAWKSISEGAEIKNIRAFLYRIAKNLIIDESRKKKEESLEILRENGFEPSSEEIGYSPKFLDGASAIELLDQLDEMYRESVYLRYVEHWKPKEIAEHIGETPEVVSTRITRGIKKMRVMLNQKSQAPASPKRERGEPNPKQISNSKFKSPNTSILLFWILVFGHWSLFVIWNL